MERIKHIPIKLLIIVAVSIFLAEAFIMFSLLPNMPSMSPHIEAIFDAFILTALVFPMIYVFLFRPLILHIIERKKAEESTRLAYAELDQVFQTSADGMRVIDKNFNMIRINETFAKLAGIDKKEAIGKKCYEIFKGAHCNTPNCSLKRVLDGEERIEFEALRERKDKTMVPCIVTATAFRNPQNEIIGIVEDFKDMTEYKRLEKQLIQAQKMEAVGKLAGGIAHDFNNILTAIMGYASIVHSEVSENKIKTYMSRILRSSKRAADLTKGLLAFSKGQIINPKPVDLDMIIQDVVNLLSNILGEDIELSVVLSDHQLVVMADTGQIEQVLMNMITNARDAMPNGGKLSIKTYIKEIDDEFINTHGYGKKGMYAVITIEDTGHGMNEEVMRRIFEPFFTTKDIGKGTGLGLSMVYGIIKQHDGYIDVCSRPNEGTIFNIYLPLIRSKVEEIKPEKHYTLRGGNETILIAEDDDYVKEFLRGILEEYGYKVIIASDGEEAINIYNKNEKNIHLLIIDVIMPKKNGKEVYDYIKIKNPNIKSIFISGYDKNTVLKKGLYYGEGCILITKPIFPDELLSKIRECLNNQFPKNI